MGGLSKDFTGGVGLFLTSLCGNRQECEILFTFCARIAQDCGKQIAEACPEAALNLGDQGNALLFCEGSANLPLPGVGLLDQEPENLGVLSIG